MHARFYENAFVRDGPLDGRKGVRALAVTGEAPDGALESIGVVRRACLRLPRSAKGDATA